MSAVEMNPKLLVRAPQTTTFAHMGEVYVYHDLIGYILKMSPDILAFLDAFDPPMDPADVCVEFADAFDEQPPEQFVGIFMQFHCLIKPGIDPFEELWSMAPVKARWNASIREDDGTITFYTAWGDRPEQIVTLSADDAAIYEAMDGESKLSVLGETFGRDAVRALVTRLVHHDVQAVKLSAVPLSLYEGRQHLKPPYLSSTMPYAHFDIATDTLPPGVEGFFSPEGYYEEEVGDADEQFDHQETTLSHLFRRPHPALGGRTYGKAFIDGLATAGHLPDAPEGRALKVMEIGGGLGYVAKAAYEALTERYGAVDYTILELCPPLAAAQEKLLEGTPVKVHPGNATDPSTWPEGPFDFVLSNEMIGDLPAERLSAEETRASEGLEDGEWEMNLATLGDAGAWILKYSIPIGDHPDPLYLNTGAFKLVEDLKPAMAPGAVAVLTEFGQMGRYPVLSTQLDHPELSIHFGQVSLVAKENGFDCDVPFVMDLIDLDRDAEGLATTRSWYRALRNLLAAKGVTLEKVAHTRTSFEALLEGKVELKALGGIEYDLIENRLMGLVPHEFKAMVLKHSADAE